jgi:sulfoxide reductase catalytic subunit YedY
MTELGNSMNRREFVDLLIRQGTMATLALNRTFSASPQSDRARRRLIVPTDAPDRFGLKVMEFNPIVAPDPAAWELAVGGMVVRPLTLKASDLRQFSEVSQSSRMKCVQCWSGRAVWGGFRCGELFRLVQPKPAATWVRIDCADRYYDFVKMEDLMHPRTLFAVKMNSEPLLPEHGAPLRLVIPFKYGYKSSKLITKLTFVDRGGQGVVADTWPYYSQTGEIEPGVDHPFDFPGETRKIKSGEILEY